MLGTTKKSYFYARLNRVFPEITEADGFYLCLGGRSFLNYQFGTRAILSSPDNLEILLHEVAHAIEFGANEFENRVNESGEFVFHLPYQFLNGQAYVDLNTSQPSMRELRTFGIQLALIKASGYKKNTTALALEWVDSLRYMPDHYLLFSHKVLFYSPPLLNLLGQQSLPMDKFSFAKALGEALSVLVDEEGLNDLLCAIALSETFAGLADDEEAVEDFLSGIEQGSQVSFSLRKTT